LKAISGITEANYGAVLFDGRDITHAPPNEIAAIGITQMPGGNGVFPSLSVRENLRAAGWLLRSDRAEQERRIVEVLEVFPALASREDETAVNLSGGQQQMLALAMSLLARPRLLIIDELSLGLAPVIVSRLAEIVRDVARSGTTILLVEQSVNVALTMASTAFFMERGRIRFAGPAEELLARPDLLRAVFLAGGESGDGDSDRAGAPTGGRSRRHRGGEPAAARNGEPPPTAPLELMNVTRRFGGISAVEDVTLRVADREIVGLIGQNGAGKTTIFDLICGYQPLDGGRILLGGVDVSSWSPTARARSGLGRTFQGGQLFPGLTVSDSIAVSLDRSLDARDPFSAAFRLPAHIDSELSVSARVEELLGLFGIEDYRDLFTAELSTGTRRIVELACAVGHQPGVLLLDEPAAGIAQREVEALSALLWRIRDDLGCSIVVVEHDMPLIAGLVDRLVALEGGTVIAEGDPDDVLTDPRVIASYLGDDHAAVARSGAAGPPMRTNGAGTISADTPGGGA